MLKITERDYTLPQVQALLGVEVLSTGSTEPMLIRGVDMDSGLRNRYVVKFMGSPRMNNISACHELLGSWIGKQLGLNVAEPAIIHVGDTFVQTMQGRNGFLNARNSIGINYGCIYYEGYAELVSGKALLSNQLLEQAQDIFAFDIFISNSDRGAGKPNVLSNGEIFLLYDHELAFSFVMLLPFLRSKTPWILGENERELIEKHHFFPYLRLSAIDFNEFTSRFLALDDYFWTRVNEFIPPGWFGNHLYEIRSYLDAIIEHKETFAEELAKTLLR